MILAEKSATLPFFLLVVGSWATVMGGTWFLFDKLEITVAQENRAKVGRWLKGLRPRVPSNAFVSALVDGVDEFFGRAAFSAASLFKSTLFGFALFCLGLAAWTIVNQDEVIRLTAAYGWPAVRRRLLPALVFCVGFVYLAVVKNHLLLRLLRRRRSTSALLVSALLVDCLLTASLAVGGLVLMERASGPFQGLGSVSGVDRAPLAPATWEWGVPQLAIWVGIFFSSGWLWLYVIAGLSTRALISAGNALRAVQRFLDVEGRPFHSMGVVAICITTVAYVLFGLVLWIV